MLELSKLSRPANYIKKKKKRVGRGNGSNGTYSGRGCKGAKSRSGFSHKWGYEGGQMPLHRRLPKRGFTNIFKEDINIVNVAFINDNFEDGDVVNKENLISKGIIKHKKNRVKILGNGDLSKKVEVSVDLISKTAEEKILKAGGTIK
jgi:large subunit ribosomal protein L15